MIAELSNRKISLEDYLSKTPEGHFELIDGILREPPVPGYEHQDSSVSLASVLHFFVKSNNLGTILSAPMDVVLENGVVVQPDILFISKRRKEIITSKNIQGPPDLVIEIVSPHSFYHDTVKKKSLYQKNGISEYWIVYPDEKIIEKFVLIEGNYQLKGTFFIEDIVTSSHLPGLEIKMTEIFNS